MQTIIRNQCGTKMSMLLGKNYNWESSKEAHVCVKLMKLMKTDNLPSQKSLKDRNKCHNSTQSINSKRQWSAYVQEKVWEKSDTKKWFNGVKVY